MVVHFSPFFWLNLTVNGCSFLNLPSQNLTVIGTRFLYHSGYPYQRQLLKLMGWYWWVVDWPKTKIIKPLTLNRTDNVQRPTLNQNTIPSFNTQLAYHQNLYNITSGFEIENWAKVHTMDLIHFWLWRGLRYSTLE